MRSSKVLLLSLLLWATPAGAQLAQTGAGSSVTAPSNLPLDGISTGVKACYSTRQLLTSYVANKAVRVQRLDSTQADIGFVSNVLDTATLTTFCSGTDAVAITWYDQCGGGFNLTPAAIGNAPTICTAGVVKTLNGKSALLFSSASSNYLQNTSLSANAVNTLYQNTVFSLINLGEFTWSSPTVGALGLQILGGTGFLELDKINQVAVATSTSGVSVSTGSIIELQYNATSGAWSYFINRVAAGTGTNVQTPTAGSSYFGATTGPAGFLNGTVGETIQYDISGSFVGPNQTTLTANQHTYWGTP